MMLSLQVRAITVSVRSITKQKDFKKTNYKKKKEKKKKLADDTPTATGFKKAWKTCKATLKQ